MQATRIVEDVGTHWATCNVCDHLLEKLELDWECTHKCRCTMRGCVPRLDKYGTLKKEENPDD